MVNYRFERTAEKRVSLNEYYARLDLPDTASLAEVKRAYRRLRARYHPDRNKGRESTVEPVFKRIQEAFEILTGERQPPATPPATNKARSKDSRPHTHRSAPPMRGANCLVELFVPLEAAIFGGEVESTYAIKTSCRQCPREGSGCAACSGTGVADWRKSTTVKVPPGAWDGQRLVVEGGGHPGLNGGPSGDAIFSVAIVCNSTFRRDGLNLAREIHIDFVTATLGGNVTTRILGRPLKVAIPPNAQPGTAIRLPGHGLSDRHGKRGDLTLSLVLAMPAAVSHLTPDERQRLREIFANAERRATRPQDSGG